MLWITSSLTLFWYVKITPGNLSPVDAITIGHLTGYSRFRDDVERSARLWLASNSVARLLKELRFGQVGVGRAEDVVVVERAQEPDAVPQIEPAGQPTDDGEN